MRQPQALRTRSPRPRCRFLRRSRPLTPDESKECDDRADCDEKAAAADAFSATPSRVGMRHRGEYPGYPRPFSPPAAPSRPRFASLSSCVRPSFEGYKSWMAATGHSSAELEIVSPELVLVDPRLATDIRGLLSNLDDTLERLEQESSLDSAEPPLLVERNVNPGSSGNEEVAAARRRLTERSELEQPKRRSLRLFVVSRLRRRRAPSPSS